MNHYIKDIFLIVIFLMISFLSRLSYALEADGSGDRPSGLTALYLFNETTGDIMDTSGVGAALNLTVDNSAAVIRGNGFVNIKQDTTIRSKSAATKIINSCGASNEITLEMWIKNNRQAKLPEDISGDPFPLTIFSLGTAAGVNDISFNQFYEDSDIYRASYNTTAGERESNTSSGVVEIGQLQHIYLVKDKFGFSTTYVSDDNGRNILRVQDAIAGNFDWNPNSMLTIGQRAFVDAQAPIEEKLSWKGEIHLLAIYCRGLSKEEIQGVLLPKPVFEAFTPDTSKEVTENEKKAALLYQRLVGVKTPIDNPIISSMATLIKNNNLRGAANLATAENGFYNITVRDFASRMSSREETVNAGLNDFVASFIGIARDGRNAQELLTGNFYYAGDPAKTAVPNNLVNDMLKSNKHYEALDKEGYDLANVLKRYDTQSGGGQKVYNGVGGAVNAPETAGVLTSRAFMAAHAVAGTNRRLVEFSFREFLCIPIEKWSDSTGPDNMVGMDVDRFPAGDHTKFKVSCRSCHSNMDGLRPAFSKWSFSSNYAKVTGVVSAGPGGDENEDSMAQNPLGVAAKYNQNSHIFPGGFQTTDNQFINFSNRGVNSNYFGWGGNLSGKGINGFGKMITEAKAFPRCLTQRAFRSVCKREPASIDQTMIERVSKEFSENGFKLRDLFERVAITPECLGAE